MVINVYSQTKIGVSSQMDFLFGKSQEEITIGEISNHTIIHVPASLNLTMSHKFTRKPFAVYSKGGLGFYPIEFLGTIFLSSILPGFFKPTMSTFFNYELGGTYSKNEKTSFSFSKTGMITKKDTYIFENEHIHGFKLQLNKRVLNSKFFISGGINTVFVRVNTPRYDPNTNQIFNLIKTEILIGPSFGINFNN